MIKVKGRYKGQPITVRWGDGNLFAPANFRNAYEELMLSEEVNLGHFSVYDPQPYDSVDAALIIESLFDSIESTTSSLGPWQLDVMPPAEWELVKHYGPGSHPGTGTSQDVHAGGVVTSFEGPLAGSDNSLANFDEALATKVRDQTEKHLGTEEEIRDRYIALMESAAQRPTTETDEWRFWYRLRHEEAEALATKDIPVEDVVGMTSAISPGLEWGKNSRLAKIMATTVTENPKLGDHITPEAMDVLQDYLDNYAEKYDFNKVSLTPDMRFNDFADLTHRNMAAVVFKAISDGQGEKVPARYGFSTYGDGLAILWGQDEPETLLRGIKTRSFHNNMLALPDDDHVTIDVQMMGAARGIPITKERDGNLESSLVGTPSRSKVGVGKDSVGVRPLLADVVRDVTTEFNRRTDDPWDDLLPRQVQAILWKEFKVQNGID